MVDVGAIGRHAEGVQAGALRREVLFVGGDRPVLFLHTAHRQLVDELRGRGDDPGRPH